MNKLKVLISVALIATAFLFFGNSREVFAETDSDSYPTKLELTNLYIQQDLSNNEETVYLTEPSSSYPYKAGTVSDETLDYALNVINYIRYIAHLDSIELKEEYTELAQCGVVLLDALSTVTHTVEYSDKPEDMQDTFFYQAQNGVSFSNLSYGQASFRDSISVQMHDGDSFENLLVLGHRRYILNPMMLSTGLGVYNNYYAVYTLDKGNSSAEYDFVAWPVAGNQPTEFHVAQEPWSITLNPSYYDTSNLNEAQITVFKAETEESVTINYEDYYSSKPSITTGYFSTDTTNYGVNNCIAFHPGTDNIGTDNTGNYLVCVSGLKTKSGEATSIIYETSLFSVESYAPVIEYPKKEGYTFDGWYYDEELTKPYDENDTETQDVDKDTLYVKWVANEYYVWYYANGGSGSNGGLILEKATYDQPYTFLSSGFAYQNSRLVGWSTTRNGEVEYELGATIDSWNRNSSLVLYAVWGLDDYTLSFVTNSSFEIEDVELKAESFVDLSQYVPTKEGYEFAGWFLDPELTTAVTEFTIKADTVVYAGWTEIVDPVVPDSTLDKTSKTAYISGYDDNSVRPEENITRGEVAKIFYTLLTEESREYYQTTRNSFTDVQEGDWYNEAIATLANANIIDGYSDGTFLPKEKITRAELVKITASFEEVTDITANPFTDVKNHWAEVYILYAASQGWINGYSDNTFKPDQYITRAETIKIVNGVTNRSLDDYRTSDFTNIWEDNSDATKWYYWDIQIATNTHNIIYA